MVDVPHIPIRAIAFSLLYRVDPYAAVAGNELAIRAFSRPPLYTSENASIHLKVIGSYAVIIILIIERGQSG